MSNPLHKNKVIQFIKRYPNSSNFTLTTGNPPIAVKPGDSGSDASFRPGCSVGLSGAAGNPANFNTLIQMWNAGGLTRNNINPFGLMRLWAAAYRTYFDFVRQVKRPYFNPSSGTTVITSPITPEDYSVTFTGATGTASVSGKNLSGVFVKGTPSYNKTTGLLEELILDKRSLTGVDVEGFFPNFLLNEYDAGSNTLDAPFGAIGLIAGGPIKCELAFNDSVDITAIKIPVPTGATSYNNANRSNSTPYNWFQYNNFKLRASYDGLNYTSELTYNNPIQSSSLSVTSYKKYINRTSTVSVDTQLDNATSYELLTQNVDVSNGHLFRGYLTTGNILAADSIQNAGSFNSRTCVIEFFQAPNTTISGRSEFQVDFSPITKGLELPNGELNLTLTRNGVPFPARIRTFYSGGNIVDTRQDVTFTSINVGTSTISPGLKGKSFVPDIYKINSLFKFGNLRISVLDISNPNSPVSLSANGRCESLSLNQLKNLEITSGYVDNGVLTPYLVSFIYVVGNKKKIVTNLSSTSTGEYTPNFSESFWSTNSPESYVLDGVTLTDEITKEVFNTLPNTYSNVDKWRLMPYTLPFSSILLESKINLSSATVRNIPSNFNYTEDYLTNQLIPLPTLNDLNGIEAAAKARGLSPQVYYYRLAISKFLQELIVYCGSTCLKFWRWEGSQLSVSNYRIYTNSMLNVDSLTRFVPVDNKGKPISTGIGTYAIPISGSFDIETNTAAGQMWFLSGGGASRVDVDLAVLEKLLDISGITV
ncbi:MAG: hypothetical protein HEQ35_06605 [Gloeotrichia echinulata IR180]